MPMARTTNNYRTSYRGYSAVYGDKVLFGSTVLPTPDIVAGRTTQCSRPRTLKVSFRPMVRIRAAPIISPIMTRRTTIYVPKGKQYRLPRSFWTVAPRPGRRSIGQESMFVWVARYANNVWARVPRRRSSASPTTGLSTSVTSKG